MKHFSFGTVFLILFTLVFLPIEVLSQQTNENKNALSNKSIKNQIEKMEERINELEKEVTRLHRKIARSSISKTSLPKWTSKIQTNSKQKVLGDTDAPVTITEYLDFQCPFCRRYQKRTFPKIRKRYIRTGKVFYQVKHFPLDRAHDQAVSAAIASECAARQDKFWEYRHLAFNNYKNLSQKNLIEFGKIIKVADHDKYKQCVENRIHEKTVQTEMREGRRKGVEGTPSFIINGDTFISGARSFITFRNAIESAL